MSLIFTWHSVGITTIEACANVENDDPVTFTLKNAGGSHVGGSPQTVNPTNGIACYTFTPLTACTTYNLTTQAGGKTRNATPTTLGCSGPSRGAIVAYADADDGTSVTFSLTDETGKTVGEKTVRASGGRAEQAFDGLTPDAAYRLSTTISGQTSSRSLTASKPPILQVTLNFTDESYKSPDFRITVLDLVKRSILADFEVL